MFCDQCGSQVIAGQQYCSRCGKRILGQFEGARSRRVHEHVRMLAILWMAYSALNVISGVMTIAIADTVVRNIGRIIQMPAEVSLVLHPIMVSAGVLTLVKAAASFLAGWGLLQREPWARILALVVAFIGLLNLPLGTALGIYTIWVLLPTESDQEYRSLALRQAA